MIYIIAGYVVAAILIIFIYYRYSKFCVASANEGKSLAEKHQTQLAVLQKEKSEEEKLRLNAEKKIALALQKIEEMENRINDWNEMQQSVMSDFLTQISHVGEDIYEKLSLSYENEAKKLLEEIAKNSTTSAKIESPTNSPQKTEDNEVSGSSTIKNVIKTLLEIFKSSLLALNKDYFLQQNLEASLMLCEVILFKNQTLYFIDLKLLRYIDEFKILNAKDPNFAQENLIKRVDKYLAYVSNPKYNKSILKALAAKNIHCSEVVNLLLTQGEKELSLLEKMGYKEKAQELNLQITDVSSINKL